MQFNVERVITKLTKGWVVDIKNPDDPLSQGSETDSSMPEGFDSILMWFYNYLLKVNELSKNWAHTKYHDCKCQSSDPSWANAVNTEQ